MGFSTFQRSHASFTGRRPEDSGAPSRRRQLREIAGSDAAFLGDWRVWSRPRRHRSKNGATGRLKATPRPITTPSFGRLHAHVTRGCGSRLGVCGRFSS